jgi:hypothetical protein
MTTGRRGGGASKTTAKSCGPFPIHSLLRMKLISFTDSISAQMVSNGDSHTFLG